MISYACYLIYKARTDFDRREEWLAKTEIVAKFGGELADQLLRETPAEYHSYYYQLFRALGKVYADIPGRMGTAERHFNTALATHDATNRDLTKLMLEDQQDMGEGAADWDLVGRARAKRLMHLHTEAAGDTNRLNRVAEGRVYVIKRMLASIVEASATNDVDRARKLLLAGNNAPNGICIRDNTDHDFHGASALMVAANLDMLKLLLSRTVGDSNKVCGGIC